MPYCASFKAGRFDFVLVNVHIYFGRSGSRVEREKEIAVLADHLIKQSRKHRKARVFDPDFFVVGDFNIKMYGGQFFAPSFSALSRTFEMPDQMDNMKTNWRQTGIYDKIAWRRATSFSFSGRSNVVAFRQILFHGP